MKKFFILNLFFLFCLSNTYAQQQPKCATSEFETLLLNANPSLQNGKNNLEQYIKNFIHSSNPHTLDIITIPVVVHVIGDNAISYVDHAKAEEQINILNEDFGKVPNSPGDGDGVN